MPVARPESSDSRIIAHIDMDCFYVQGAKSAPEGTALCSIVNGTGVFTILFKLSTGTASLSAVHDRMLSEVAKTFMKFVEQRKQPELRGLPTAVVQYNEWKGGALIAVSYEARKFGVKRSMRGDEAKEVCPQIQLVQVPVARDKADLNAYRDAGSEVVSILARRGRCERASIDEVYLDLTDSAQAMLIEAPPESLEEIDEEALKSHILGLENEDGKYAKENVREWLCRSDADRRDKLLACGVLIVAELRMQVLKETEFTCSAGIAHNKMLAKLASAMNKPAQQTVVPLLSVKGLLDSLPIKKMKHLGGKLGTSLQNDLGLKTIGDLLQFSEQKLQDHYGINTGTWLWNIARGISGEEVQGRLLPKSHGSGKLFPGPRALKTVSSVQHWLNKLCEELSERLLSDLDKNKRVAHTLTLHATAHEVRLQSNDHKRFPSKSCPLRYGTAKIQEDTFNLFQAGLREYLGAYGSKTQGSNYKGWGITSLSVSASKIIDIPAGTYSIMKYFHGRNAPETSSNQPSDDLIGQTASCSSSGRESFSDLDLDALEIEHKDSSCSSPKQAPDGFAAEVSASLPSDAKSGIKGCSGSCQSNSQVEFSKEEPRKKSILPSLEGLWQEKIVSKDKGTIMNFFKKHNFPCSSAKQENVEMVQDSQSTSHSCSEINSVAMPNHTIPAQDRTVDGRCNSDQNAKREAWDYKIDEIDQSVIGELPPVIQDEIRAWLRPRKRPNTVRRGSTIAHYFSPMKNT